MTALTDAISAEIDAAYRRAEVLASMLALAQSLDEVGEELARVTAAEFFDRVVGPVTP